MHISAGVCICEKPSGVISRGIWDTKENITYYSSWQGLKLTRTLPFLLPAGDGDVAVSTACAMLDHSFSSSLSLVRPPTQIRIPNEPDAVAEQNLEFTRNESEHEGHGGYPHRPAHHQRLGDVVTQSRPQARVQTFTSIVSRSLSLVRIGNDVLQNGQAR